MNHEQSRVFISDLHLCDERPDITQAFLDFLQSSEILSFDALYILGDLFEIWIGDDYITKLSQTIAAALIKFKNHHKNIYFLPGNRDFLLGQAYCQQAGMTLIQDGFCLKITDPSESKEHCIMLAHGDHLCVDDHAYQAFRNQVRTPDFQQQFLNQTIEQRLNIAKNIRQQSQMANQSKSQEIMDINITAWIESLDSCVQRPEYFIHGHTHRPKVHAEIKKTTRLVLGDWDKNIWMIQQKQEKLILVQSPIAQL
jgi:UDP-2,3-diacylglucosamine hydrolase